MYYDKQESHLIFILYRNNAQPTDDFLIIDNESVNDIKYATSKR
jgi:hypothetical protein